MEPKCPALQADSLPAELPRKPKARVVVEKNQLCKDLLTSQPLKLVNITVYVKSCGYINGFERRCLSWLIQVHPECLHIYPFKRGVEET